MATASVIFQVGKTRLLPYHVHVEQRVDWHHQFEVMVSTEKAKVMGGSSASESVVIDNAMAYIGESVELSIVRPSGTFQFSGIVTHVRVDQEYAGDAFVVFSGYSSTYLIDGQRVTTSFEELTLKEIMRKVTDDLPGNIERVCKPQYSEAIPYVVQYKETGYEFLSRLAAQYGEWFYYDGQSIIFGELPEGGDPVELMFGGDSMLSFNYGIDLRSTKTARKFYKYEDNETLDQSVSGFHPGWLSPHGKTALKVSEEMFPKDEVDVVDFATKDAPHLRAVAEAEKSSMLSDVMTFNGQSANPGVVLGAEVKLSSKKGFIGQYRVTAVSHTVDSHQDYYNSFDAIVSTSPVPPLNKGITLIRAEPQIAQVVDNVDPLSMGRVRVRCTWQEGLTPWIRVLTSDAGEGHGHYFTPEIGDEVLVDFEAGNPDLPFVVGSKYHGKIPPEFYDNDNNFKAIKTRSGHLILFDDTDGKESITIKDKNGNTINLDTKGKSISISSNSTINISSGNINIKASKNIQIAADENIVMSGKNVSISASESALLSGDKDATLSSGGSKTELKPAAGTLTSKKLDVNGDMMVTVTGATIKLN